MYTRIPPLNIKIMLESNPLKSRTLVRRLAVARELERYAADLRRDCEPARHAATIGLLREAGRHGLLCIYVCIVYIYIYILYIYIYNYMYAHAHMFTLIIIM